MIGDLLLDFWFPFLFIFARVTSFIAVLPFFAWRGVPVMLRVFFSFVLSVLLALTWEGQLFLPAKDLGLIFLLAQEVIVGLVLGFLVYMYLSVFLMSGQFMDHKAGLMMAATFDPMFAGQVTIIGQFFYFLAVVIYLSSNGHHLLFLALHKSFTVIPLTGSLLSLPTLWFMVKTFGALFLLAFQIAAPVIVVLWVMDLALGFLSKTVPQIHVFIVGLPLKIAFVLLIFLLLIPLLSGIMRDVFQMMGRDLVLIMENWSG